MMYTHGALAMKKNYISRHPSESWGPLDHLSNGTASGDASLRWHDGQM
jgi:hypothetical protein